MLLAGSVGLNFYYFNKYRDFSQRYNQLAAQQTELAKNNEVLQTKVGNYENAVAMLNSPDMAQIKMEGSAVPASSGPGQQGYGFMGYPHQRCLPYGK